MSLTASSGPNGEIREQGRPHLLNREVSRVYTEVVDITFRLSSDGHVPQDHLYGLYGALSRRLPWLHEVAQIGVFPLTGDAQNGQLRLTSRSRLRLRAPVSELHRIIALTGATLEVAGGGPLGVGVPTVFPLRPAATLYARLVQIKLADTSGGITPEAFLESAQRQLGAAGIGAQAAIPLRENGPHAGEPMRGVLRIKGERHVGFALLVEGLTAEESVQLQEQGLGGRRKMGCGLFLPHRRIR